MDPMSMFMAEAASFGVALDSVPAPTSQKVASKGKAVSTSGTLLIAGSTDFDNMTSGNADGIEGFHRIVLESKIAKTYSSSSATHMFVETEDQEVYAYGSNLYGQLSCGTETTQKWPLRIALPSRVTVKTISTGRYHSLLLSTQGDLYACGSNLKGQLGLGSQVKFEQISVFTKVNVDGKKVQDCAAGSDFSVCCTTTGRLYTWGNPECGQLGHGTTGAYFKDGGKGPMLQYDYKYLPILLESMVRKDRYHKDVQQYSTTELMFTAVAAGKNHALALEAYEGRKENLGRVFSWGNGAYGRLGHAGADDELIPREITAFSRINAEDGTHLPQVASTYQIRHLLGGSSFSLAVSSGGQFFHFGKMQSAKKGEPTMYPKMVDDLVSMSASSRIAAGHNSIFICYDDPQEVVAWGAPVGGTFGFEGNAKSSVAPKYLEKMSDFKVLDITSSYGSVHVVIDDEDDNKAKVESLFPELVNESLNSKGKKKGREMKDGNKAKKAKL